MRRTVTCNSWIITVLIAFGKALLISLSFLMAVCCLRLFYRLWTRKMGCSDQNDPVSESLAYYEADQYKPVPDFNHTPTPRSPMCDAVSEMELPPSPGANTSCPPYNTQAVSKRMLRFDDSSVCLSDSVSGVWQNNPSLYSVDTNETDMTSTKVETMTLCSLLSNSEQHGPSDLLTKQRFNRIRSPHRYHKVNTTLPPPPPLPLQSPKPTLFCLPAATNVITVPSSTTACLRVDGDSPAPWSKSGDVTVSLFDVKTSSPSCREATLRSLERVCQTKSDNSQRHGRQGYPDLPTSTDYQAGQDYQAFSDYNGQVVQANATPLKPDDDNGEFSLISQHCETLEC